MPAPHALKMLLVVPAFLLAACGGGGDNPVDATSPELEPATAPVIRSFSPDSGTAGTIITVNGNDLGETTGAWVGSSTQAAVNVVGATRVLVTVPEGASSGALKLVSRNGSSTSSGLFTVLPVSLPQLPAGTLSLRVQGSRLVDARGGVVQLRGVNFSGLEFVPIQGWSPGDPTGGQGGQAGGPDFAAMKSWKINAVRLPLNEASWLGYSCTDASGVTHNPDPGGNYRSTVQSLVKQANANGMYVILVLHWAAPGSMCPMLQSQMADADHSLAFWTSIAGTFRSNPAVMFELFNEPFFDFDFSGDAWSTMMKGTGGSFSGYPATGNGGDWKDVKKPWAVASYQSMIDAVRATGATNIVLVGTLSYSQDFSGWLAHKPTDRLGQMAAAWHPYRKFATAWDYPYPNYHPQVMSDAQGILDAGIPLVMTEVGGQNTAGTRGSPIIDTMTAFADNTGASVLGWTWNVWGAPENVLIKDVHGTPTDGYGVTFRNWLLLH